MYNHFALSKARVMTDATTSRVPATLRISTTAASARSVQPVRRPCSAPTARRYRPTVPMPSRTTTRPRSRRTCAARSSAIRTSEAPGTIIIDTPNTYPLLRARRRQGDALRHRRRPRRLHLVGRQDASSARPSGRTGSRRPRCSSASPTCRASWPAARAIRSAPAPCISAARSTASTAPTQPSSIGKRVSSGCIRMVNEDVIDLYTRVNVGTKVVVLPMSGRHAGTGTDNVN